MAKGEATSTFLYVKGNNKYQFKVMFNLYVGTCSPKSDLFF